MAMKYNRREHEHDFTSLLEGATKDDLQQLIDNEDKVNELICDQAEVTQIKLDKELLQAEIRSIADHNLSKEPLLNEKRQTLAAKYEQLKELNDSYLMKQAEMDSLKKDVNLETMLAVLQTTCAQTEEESEELAENFFKGVLSLGDFVSEFKAKRTLAHMRRIKAEKMRELILAVERNPSPQQSPSPAIPPRIPTTSTARNVPPYPGSNQPLPYPGQYSQNRYPANAFSQPPAQQYPGYSWN